MIVKPVCVKCRCFYRPEKNGYAFIEGMPNGSAGPRENVRGHRRPDAWQPYKVWMGDLWKCPDCDHELIVGVVGGPIAEHFQPEFSGWVKRLGADQLQVNDC